MKTNPAQSRAARCRAFEKISPRESRLASPTRGFTLVELLALLAMLAVLALMSLPALCKTNLDSQAFTCMNNKRQLTQAWLMFAADNNEQLPSSRNWIGGDFGLYGTSSTDCTNVSYLIAGALNSYVGNSIGVYKCPGDTRTYGGVPIVRSVSMNCYIGIGWTGGFFVYTKISDLRRPGPANTIVFTDEGPTLNDGFFVTDMGSYDPSDRYKYSTCAPGAYHSMADSLSFADGHCEIHKWKDTQTLTVTTTFTWVAPNDIDWLQSKSSARSTYPTR